MSEIHNPKPRPETRRERQRADAVHSRALAGATPAPATKPERRRGTITKCRCGNDLTEWAIKKRMLTCNYCGEAGAKITLPVLKWLQTPMEESP